MHRDGCGKFEKGDLRKGEQVFENKSSSFIGSHPMAGSEKAGMEFATAELLSQKNCIITPTKNTSKYEINKISMLWERLGMEASSMGIEEHDEVMSWISHLPHLVASSHVQLYRNPKMVRYCGNGLGTPPESLQEIHKCGCKFAW